MNDFTEVKKSINTYAEEFEKKLSACFAESDTEYSVITDACRYSLLLGGKRLRPYLMHSFYKLCGGEGDGSFGFEAAIECIHTYSLIHDDLPCMDNDDMRRGKPSCHVKFGEANALLAGDALLTAAFGIAAESTASSPTWNTPRAPTPSWQALRASASGPTIIPTSTSPSPS